MSYELPTPGVRNCPDIEAGRPCSHKPPIVVSGPTTYAYGNPGGGAGGYGFGSVSVIARDLSAEQFCVKVKELRDRGGAECSLHKAMWDLAQRLI